MEVNDTVDVIVSTHIMSAFSDNFNNKFFKYMEEKFYDGIMSDPEVKEAFKFMIGAPVLEHVDLKKENLLELRLIITMEAKNATYWKLKWANNYSN